MLCWLFCAQWPFEFKAFRWQCTVERLVTLSTQNYLLVVTFLTTIILLPGQLILRVIHMISSAWALSCFFYVPIHVFAIMFIVLSLSLCQLSQNRCWKTRVCIAFCIISWPATGQQPSRQVSRCQIWSAITIDLISLWKTHWRYSLLTKSDINILKIT